MLLIKKKDNEFDSSSCMVCNSGLRNKKTFLYNTQIISWLILYHYSHFILVIGKNKNLLDFAEIQNSIRKQVHI